MSPCTWLSSNCLGSTPLDLLWRVNILLVLENPKPGKLQLQSHTSAERGDGSLPWPAGYDVILWPRMWLVIFSVRLLCWLLSPTRTCQSFPVELLSWWQASAAYPKCNTLLFSCWIWWGLRISPGSFSLLDSKETVRRLLLDSKIPVVSPQLSSVLTASSSWSAKLLRVHCLPLSRSLEQYI